MDYTIQDTSTDLTQSDFDGSLCTTSPACQQVPVCTDPVHALLNPNRNPNPPHLIDDDGCVASARDDPHGGSHDSTVLHAHRVRRLYSAWHATAGIATYAALRDETLALCEQMDAWVSALHFVAQLAYPEQVRSEKTWKDFTAAVKSAENRSETARRTSKQAANEVNRQRNITLLRVLWSPQVVSYYSWDSASQSQLNALRACAERYPRFEDQFRPRLNHVLLERHCVALLRSHTKTLNEAAFQPHRDLDQVLSKSTPLHKSLQRLWTNNRDGNIAIDRRGTTLASVRPQHYHMYLLQLDAHGVLCPRTSSAPAKGDEANDGMVDPRTGTESSDADDEEAEAIVVGNDIDEHTDVPDDDPIAEDDGERHDSGVQHEVHDEQHVVDDDAMDEDLDEELEQNTDTRDNIVAQNMVEEYNRSPPNGTTEAERWNEFPWGDSPIPAGDTSTAMNLNAGLEIDWDLHQTFIDSLVPADDTSNTMNLTADLEVDWGLHQAFLDSPTATGLDLGNASTNFSTNVAPPPPLLNSNTMPEVGRLGTNTCHSVQRDPQTIAAVVTRDQALSDDNTNTLLDTNHAPRLNAHVNPFPIEPPNTTVHIDERINSTGIISGRGIGSESVESILRNRYKAMMNEYIDKIAREAKENGAGIQRLLRAKWLKADVEMASIYTSPQSNLPPGTAHSMEHADAIYFTASEFMEQARHGAVFHELIIIKESFADAGMHKFEDVVAQVQDSYDGSMLHVRWLDQDQSIAVPCAKVVEYLRTQSSARASRELNLRSLRKCHRPTFTMMQRFRLLETLMIRVRDLDSSPNNNASSLDTDRSLYFNTVSARGAFSGPRLGTASGSWIRILDGVSLYAIASLSDSNKDLYEDTYGAPTSNLKLLVLERDDVLILPPGLGAVYAVHSPTNVVAEGGFFWDELNILETLDQALSNPLQTDSIAQCLQRLVEQLSDLVRQHPGRFCTDGDDVELSAKFDAILSRVHSVRCGS